MTDSAPIEPLVTGTKRATVHFAKAAFEVASGVGALFVGISQTVAPDRSQRDTPEDGPQKVEVE